MATTVELRAEAARMRELVEFASQALLGDSNLLSNVIQNLVLGTTPGVALHTSTDHTQVELAIPLACHRRAPHRSPVKYVFFR